MGMPALPVSGEREAVSDSEGEAEPPPSDASPSPEEAAGMPLGFVRGKLRPARPTVGCVGDGMVCGWGRGEGVGWRLGREARAPPPLLYHGFPESQGFWGGRQEIAGFLWWEI